MLTFQNRHLKRICVTFGLCLWFGAAVRAEDHVVSTEELSRQAVAASASRQSNRVTLEKFFSSQPASQALQKARVDRAQLTQSVSLLSDDELARLAARAQQAQNDFAAGALSNLELTYIVIALVTAVVILVIVAA